MNTGKIVKKKIELQPNLIKLSGMGRETSGSQGSIGCVRCGKTSSSWGR